MAPEALRNVGLDVRADYNPEDHRGHIDDSEDPGEPDDSAWSWESDHHPARTRQTVSSSRVYTSPWLSLRRDTVRRPDGSVHPYVVVDSADTALVIAAEGDQLHLVEQYRYPIAGRSWEFPSGSADVQRDADPWALAARELREETGWFARDHVQRMIKDGVITDARTCAAYTLLLLHEQTATWAAPTGPPPAPSLLPRRHHDL